MKIQCLFRVAAICALLFFTKAGLGQTADAALELGVLFEENCSTCHGPETQTAGINLTSLVEETPLVKNLETWRRVIGALEVGKMPPPGAPQPSVAVRERMLGLLRNDIENTTFLCLITRVSN